MRAHVPFGACANIRVGQSEFFRKPARCAMIRGRPSAFPAISATGSTATRADIITGRVASPVTRARLVAQAGQAVSSSAFLLMLVSAILVSFWSVAYSSSSVACSSITMSS